jgi:hypothetical protein
VSDPLPVIPLQYATPSAQRRLLPRAIAVFLWMGWGACALAVLLIAAVSVESVLVTGPVLFAFGLLAVLGGIWARSTWGLVAGLGHCAICILFIALVNLLGWSPRTAQEPFLWMGLAYTIASLPVTLLGARRPRNAIE